MIPIDPKLSLDSVPPGCRPKIYRGRGSHDLPTIVTPGGTVITRWRLSPEERAKLLAGDDLFVAIWIGNEKLPPLMVNVGTRDWSGT